MFKNELPRLHLHPSYCLLRIPAAQYNVNTAGINRCIHKWIHGWIPRHKIKWRDWSILQDINSSLFVRSILHYIPIKRNISSKLCSSPIFFLFLYINNHNQEGKKSMKVHPTNIPATLLSWMYSQRMKYRKLNNIFCLNIKLKKNESVVIIV